METFNNHSIFLIGTILLLCILLWWNVTTKLNLQSPPRMTQQDNFLVRNYHTKVKKWQKKVVLIIESYNNIDELLTLIRNILKQDIKVDSIILISTNKMLDKVPLIHNTCIINKIGGLSFLLKESGNDTILLFIFKDAFHVFSKPQFLKNFIFQANVEKINGLIKLETNSVNVDINKIYF